MRSLIYQGFLAYLLCLPLGCGENSNLNEGNIMSSGGAEDQELSNMKLYSTKSDLPSCIDTIRNYMAYVSSEKKIYSCNGSSWVAVDLGSDAEQTGTSAGKEIFSINSLDSGSKQCSYGGVLVEKGIDNDGDQKLSASEITVSKAVCNGADGMDIEAIYSYSVGFDYDNAEDISPVATMLVHISHVQLVKYTNGSYFLSVNGGVFVKDVGEDYGWADFNHTQMFASSDEMYESSLMKFQLYDDVTIFYMFSKENNPVLSVSVNITTNASDAEFFDYYLYEE